MTSQADNEFADTAWSERRLSALANQVHAEGLDETESIAVRAPATETEIGSIPSLTESDVATAVSTTRDAAAEWRSFSPSQRATVIERFSNLVADKRSELLDLVQLETGKSRIHALEETIDVPQSADYYAENGPSLLEAESRRSGIPLASTVTVQHDPVGVVGVISPWNYPLVLSFSDAIPALMAGNGVVLKPDEKTPFTALRLVELLVEAGVPEGVMTVVTGEGPTVGGALVEHVDYVTFTGSSETGRIVAAEAGRNLIDCSLELSGKNPMIVLEDANITQAARGAVHGSFTNAGQLCLATERIYVHESVYDDFLAQFVEKTEALTLGYRLEYGPDVGSLIDRDQLERVTRHVRDAVESGARVHAGGSARPDVGPFFYEPTILTGVPDNSLPACEETFGPVVTVEPIPSAEAAVEKANATDFGLNASVFSRDRERAADIAGQIEAGTVCINDPFLVGWAAYDAPMGGVGDSGIGRRHGPEGLKRYAESKTIASSRVGPLTAPSKLPDRLFARIFSAFANTHRRLGQWRR